MAGTLVANTINTDTGLFSTNNAYLGIAKAWVQFNGGISNTAGVINGSFNVSSITVNSTGNYTINFTTAMSNANYSLVGVGDSSFSIGPYNGATSYTTTSANILHSRYSTGVYNATIICVAVFSS